MLNTKYLPISLILSSNLIIIALKDVTSKKEFPILLSEESSDNRIERDGLVWLELDPLDFFDRERVPGVGMVITSSPEGTDLNRDVLNQLPNAGNLEPNSLVLILEATWNKTLLDNFEEYELIEDMEYDGVRIAVTQMRSRP